MKYKVFIPDLDDTIEDAYEVEYKCGWPEMAVEEYCNYIFHNRYGWEWMRSKKINSREKNSCVPLNHSV